MKRWIKVLIGVGIGLVLLLVILTLFAGHIVKGAINNAGPRVLGVPVSVKDVDVSLLRGRFGLTELVIGNPEGFGTPEAIRLGKVTVAVKMTSLFSKVLIIERVYVGGPEITYEVGLHGSNIGAIQDKVAPPTTGAEQPKPATKPAPSGKRVEIDDFVIENGKIHFSTIGMGGQALPIPLPTIHLTDIGKESGGASPKEVIAKVLGVIGNTVSSAAAGIGKGVHALGQGALDAGDTVGKGAARVLKGVQGLFRK